MRQITIRRFIHYTSPLGPICYVLEDSVCSRIWLKTVPGAIHGQADNVSRWLDNYFSHSHSVALPPLASPKTPFQAKLRQMLLEIPFGETCTYGELASSLGSGARAVGQALGANPLPIIIPCHRVLAQNGIGGFACGLDWKRRLLDFETSLQADSVREN